MMDSSESGQVLFQLGELKGMIDGVLREQKRVAEAAESMAVRVGIVEQRVSNVYAYAAGAGAAAGVACSVVTALFLR